VKLVRIAALPIVMLVVLAVVAAPAGAGPVLADDRYKWFYWIGPLLLIGAVFFLLALAAGYYVRVLRPKYRGRPVRK
jgi:bacteriorhodopsin